MSMPLSECRINAAALGNEEAYAALVEAMRYNLKRGAYSIFPCPHNPPCAQATMAQRETLEKRVLAAAKEKVKS
jgi:hypothetical protein